MAKWKFRKKYKIHKNEFEEEPKTFNFSRLIKRELFFTIISIMAVTIAILGGSYAVFSSIQKADNYNIIKTGTLQIAYDDTTTGLGNIINLNGAYPETDTVGQAREPYKFKITNTGSIVSTYKIRIIDDTDMITEDNCSTNQLPKDKIKYSINGDEPVLLSTKETQYIVEEGTLTAGANKTYEFRMWIDNNAGNEVLGRHYHGKIVVEAVQGKTGAEELIAKTNPVEVVDYNAGNKAEMFTFKHEAGEQQVGYSEEELTDYRYIGITPNNYVTFNNEVWRIIGVFTVENESGIKEKRIKITRNQPIGGYSWDTSESTISNGTGINEWSQADLMKLMNPEYTGVGGSLYYNKQSGSCYTGQSNTTRSCDFTVTGLSEETKGMIGDAKWWLGGSSINSGQSGPTYYAFERGNAVMMNPTDGIERTTSWIGKIGLMYPSDYAYTYANGVDNKCYTDTYNCDTSTPSTGWLFNGQNQWLLSPRSSTAYNTLFINAAGYVYNGNNSSMTFAVYPSLYLKSAIVIASGDGSSSSPYILK